MTDEWFYATQGQQKGPISGAELQRLAESHQLQPSDLVWKADLPQWITASSIEGLFAERPTAAPGPDLPAVPAAPFAPAAPATPVEPVTAVVPATPARPGRDVEPEHQDRPRRRRRVADDDDFELEPREVKPRASSSMRLILILAGGGGVVLLLVCAGFLYMIFQYTLGSSYQVRLGPNSRDVKALHFRSGTTAEIRVFSELDTDVDLYVYGPNGGLIAQDIRPSKDCYVTFRVQQSGNYRVEVVNLSTVIGNNCTVYYNSR